MPFVESYQLPLINIDPLIKLGKVERILAQVFDEVPSRPTLIKYCEEGRLLGRQESRGKNKHWYVYKSSLDAYISEFENQWLEAA